MGKKKKKLKIIKPEPTKHESQYKFVKSKPAYREKKPVFAFNYYLCDSKNCSFESIKSIKSFHILFKNLKGMSSLTWQKIKDSHQYHAHEINWTKKDIPKDIKQLQYIDEIKDLSLFQFKAFDIKETRILGLFNHDCIFEIVGLDKDHGIYGKDK
ncbi:MAG: hypothetical protein M1479_03435 [Actinobacteria bacterium]|nr:hypothetical protein [Actinomycetota bacterium]